MADALFSAYYLAVTGVTSLPDFDPEALRPPPVASDPDPDCPGYSRVVLAVVTTDRRLATNVTQVRGGSSRVGR